MPAEKALALRLLNASRFHPLLMDRLARLAADAALRPQLLRRSTRWKRRRTSRGFPALFATKPGDAKELAYLDDALATSLDQLIGAPARMPAACCGSSPSRITRVARTC